jgi:PIN domain nuclease of toxin-antitoxin system
MRILLDTNVVVGWAGDHRWVRQEVHELLTADETVRVMSAVVPWEIAIKWRAGRLGLGGHPRTWVPRVCAELVLEALPIVQAHAVRAADLPFHHRDPFDRLLIAQAQAEGIPIVTADRAFRRYDVEAIAAR